MKLLLDENLSPRLARALQDLFPGSSHVDDEGLGAADDGAIWDFARTIGYVIVSKDSDFYERSTVHGCPPKILWLRVGNSTTGELEALIRRISSAIRSFCTAPEETCLVLTRKSIHRESAGQ